MLDTAFIEPLHFICPFPYPVVIKTSHGCGGRGVMIAQNQAEYRKALETASPDSAVVQPLCDTPGVDLRVYVLGRKIIQPMLRSSHGDFRSNYGLGGSAAPAILTREQEEMVNTIAEQFDFGLVGVDFIFHKEKTLLNEIEDAVGTRMLYSNTDINIVSLYMDHILSRI